MPNWNFNEVTIDAPEREVGKFLVFENDEYRFHMSRIFPEIFPDSDPTGETGWDYDWACEHTGAKWFPAIHGCTTLQNGKTSLDYDTAWAPNNDLLLKLSQIAGWEIRNEYSEPGMCFEGTFICKSGIVLLDEEREYRHSCEQCDARYLSQDLPEDAEEHYLCPSCYRRQGG